MSVARRVLSRSRRILNNLLPPKDSVYFNGFYVSASSTRYERESIQQWYNSIKPDDIVVDVGANHGYYTLFAAKKLNNYGKVFAFEPLPSNVHELYLNIAANDFHNVTVIPAGLSDQVTVERLYVSSRSTTLSHLAGSLSLGSNPGRGRPQTYPDVALTITIDSFFQAYGAVPNAIKIDVDGDELRVIRGGRETLKGSGTKLMLENHYLQGTPGHQEQVLELLSELDFKVDSITSKPDESRHEFVIGEFSK
jgi:FkbM family methyltransferase